MNLQAWYRKIHGGEIVAENGAPAAAGPVRQPVTHAVTLKRQLQRGQGGGRGGEEATVAGDAFEI